MTIDNIRDIVHTIVQKYPISKVILFGSRAEGTNDENSDVDLAIEFYAPETLITLANLRYELEDALKLDVDVIHGPITNDDMIEIGKEVVLYAA